MSIILREACSEDAEACGAICYDAFRALAEHHSFPPDFSDTGETTGLFAHVISRDDVYTVVAESGGQIIGSNVLWENGTIAGVGPITVDPAAQGSSVGTRLMEDVLRRASENGFDSVRLVQAPFNNLTTALYSKLGFDVREPLSVMHGSALALTMPGYVVRTATAGDQDDCDKLCRQIYGHERAGDLADAIAQGTASAVEHDGRITGYATVIGFWGHAVAETNDDMRALIGAASEFAGPGFLLPSRNADLLRWCLARGLRIRQPMALMSRGPYTEPAGAFMPSILF